MLAAFIHGIVLAFGLIIPLGVLNVYVFNQGATQKHYWQTLPIVITASMSDTILITTAVTGVSVIVLGSELLKMILMIVGIGFLSYMGWQTWKSAAVVSESKNVQNVRSKQIIFTVSISLFNPHAIMDTIGVIGTSSLQYSGDEKFTFTLATILISWLWFFGLALVGRLTRKLDSTGRLLYVMNKVSAIVMWVAAIYLIQMMWS